MLYNRNEEVFNYGTQYQGYELPFAMSKDDIQFRFNGKIQVYSGSVLLYESNNNIDGNNYQLTDDLDIFYNNLLVWSSNKNKDVVRLIN